MRPPNIHSIIGNRFMEYLVISLFVISICSLPTFTNGQSDKTDFSGSWVLNEEKSDFGESQFRRAALKMTIQQKGNDMTLEKVRTNRSGETYNSTEKLTLDGKECDNTINNRVRKSTANWSEDGKNLTISTVMVFERDGQSMEIKTVEIYKISDTGDNLLIALTSSSPRGEMKQSFVYDKE